MRPGLLKCMRWACDDGAEEVAQIWVQLWAKRGRQASRRESSIPRVIISHTRHASSQLASSLGPRRDPNAQLLGCFTRPLELSRADTVSLSTPLPCLTLAAASPPPAKHGPEHAAKTAQRRANGHRDRRPAAGEWWRGGVPWRSSAAAGRPLVSADVYTRLLLKRCAPNPLPSLQIWPQRINFSRLDIQSLRRYMKANKLVRGCGLGGRRARRSLLVCTTSETAWLLNEAVYSVRQAHAQRLHAALTVAPTPLSAYSDLPLLQNMAPTATKDQLAAAVSHHFAQQVRAEPSQSGGKAASGGSCVCWGPAPGPGRVLALCTRILSAGAPDGTTPRGEGEQGRPPLRTWPDVFSHATAMSHLRHTFLTVQPSTQVTYSRAPNQATLPATLL